MNAPGPAAAVRVRNVQAGDLEEVAAIDLEITRLPKPGYWAEIYQRYGSGRRQQRFFLVAEAAGRIEGFVIGEVRDWEFGSPRCGWVFAINVRPKARLAGVASRLLEAICEGFRRLGVAKVRTLLQRDNQLILSFFRSQGMMAAPFIPLEIDLAPEDADPEMKLQKNTLFALYSVLESASHPARQLSAGAIARKYGISPHHLAKVLHTLAQAGVVESVRGVGGGYRFAGNAKRLTLMDVIERFEDIGAPARAGARRKRAGTGIERALENVLAEIDEIAKATFRSISIATMLKLVERQRRA